MTNHSEASSKNLALPLASSFITGFAIGGAIALLFAPFSGREARGRVKSAVAEGKAKAEAGIETVRTQTAEVLNSVASKAASIVEQSKNRVTTETNRIAAAASAGKEAYMRHSASA